MADRAALDVAAHVVIVAYLATTVVTATVGPPSSRIGLAVNSTSQFASRKEGLVAAVRFQHVALAEVAFGSARIAWR
jgi:hypothetical protein